MELEELIQNYETKNLHDSGLTTSITTTNNLTSLKQMLDSCLQVSEQSIMQESCIEFEQQQTTIIEQQQGFNDIVVEFQSKSGKIKHRKKKFR